ncbi:DNA damage-regulated autophagy modulator protein 2 [Arctopsyche grandis]|uniref:DNA damage-regulated autophagy modulator protein 2 n=1 Tax=Arctopsyche grandis TaxID=121162 RepID=UPI00406D7DB7
MSLEGLHALPLACFALFPATFLLTYIWAVLLEHVEPDFPYISDAATYSPESCVFGQLINIGCVLLGVTMYIRHRQILELRCVYPLASSIKRLNDLSLWFGAFSCLGLSMVANFQETNVKYVHYTGAFMCFGLGTVYFWIQALVSHALQPVLRNLNVVYLRIALSVICTIFFVILLTTGIISHVYYHGKNPRKWYPNDGGWHFHVASTASEWVVAIAFCVYILSFTEDFRNLSLDHPKICLLQETVLIVPNEEVENETASGVESEDVLVIAK